MTEVQIEKAVENIFNDIRGRRFLKWLFTEGAGENEHPIVRFENEEMLYAFSEDIQDEIKEAFKECIKSATLPA